MMYVCRLWLAYRHAIERDALGCRIGLVAKLRDTPIDGDASFFDHLLHTPDASRSLRWREFFVSDPYFLCS